jgi:hypothetical protein
MLLNESTNHVDSQQRNEQLCRSFPSWFLQLLGSLCCFDLLLLLRSQYLGLRLEPVVQAKSVNPAAHVSGSKGLPPMPLQVVEYQTTGLLVWCGQEGKGFGRKPDLPVMPRDALPSPDYFGLYPITGPFAPAASNQITRNQFLPAKFDTRQRCSCARRWILRISEEITRVDIDALPHTSLGDSLLGDLRHERKVVCNASGSLSQPE